MEPSALPLVAAARARREALNAAAEGLHAAGNELAGARARARARGHTRADAPARTPARCLSAEEGAIEHALRSPWAGLCASAVLVVARPISPAPPTHHHARTRACEAVAILRTHAHALTQNCTRACARPPVRPPAAVSDTHGAEAAFLRRLVAPCTPRSPPPSDERARAAAHTTAPAAGAPSKALLAGAGPDRDDIDAVGVQYGGKAAAAVAAMRRHCAEVDALIARLT